MFRITVKQAMGRTIMSALVTVIVRDIYYEVKKKIKIALARRRGYALDRAFYGC